MKDWGGLTFKISRAKFPPERPVRPAGQLSGQPWPVEVAAPELAPTGGNEGGRQHSGADLSGAAQTAIPALTPGW